MGVVRAGNLETVGQSNAQVVGGGLRFDSSKNQHLSRIPGSAGNRTTWTWSGWIRRNNLGTSQVLLMPGVAATQQRLAFSSADKLFWGYATGESGVITKSVFRDPSAWYHIVLVSNTSNSDQTKRIRIYVNNVEQETEISGFFAPRWPNLNEIWDVNSTNIHYIGIFNANDGLGFSSALSAQLTNSYLIDGQALDPSYFGYTDALTNTWRPKKYKNTVALPGDNGSAVGFGTNGFYLPFDGSAPIGQDQSGKVGIAWTAVNFGGSNTIEKATGALPILNTDGGGKVARVGVRTDANASSLVLALPLVGIKSDFSNAINSGTSNKAVTANGNATASSAQSNFYGGSFYFDGTGDTLSIPQSTNFDFGSGDCTVECWLYISSNASDITVAGRWEGSDQAWQLSYSVGTGNTRFGFSQNIGGTQTAESSVASAGYVGQWVHLAGQRVGNTLQIYVNGVLEGTKSVSGAHSALSGDIRVGGRTSGNYVTGYIQDLRIYKGLAKYTSNFIPASTDPDIVPDSPSGVSYSSNVALVPSTDGAVAFDGSGDYLSIPNSNDFIPGTNDFTIEGFFYLSAHSTGATTNLYGINNGGGLNPKITVYVDPNGTLHFDFTTAGGASLITSSSGTITTGVWYHIAFVRNSGVFNGYVNGSSVGSSSASINLTGLTQPFYIGYIGESYGTTLNGFVSNFNFVNGTALYTSNFTPPSAPISSVANTKLLCCKSNSSATAFDVSPGTITAVNAVATNFNPFTVNINTQRGKQSGYATLNPLDKGSAVTLSNGNLSVSLSATHNLVAADIMVSSGKYYAEFVYSTLSGGSNGLVGVCNPVASRTSYLGGTTGGVGYGAGGDKWVDGSVTGGLITSTIGDVIGIALDKDNNQVTFYKNNTLIFTQTGLNNAQPYTFAMGHLSSAGTFNFGQKPFKFPPPAGFQPLTLANLQRPSIVRPDQYVGIATYSGNSGTQSITVGFKPDFIWFKSRNEVYNHYFHDTVRGNRAELYSNTTGAEFTASTDRVTFTNTGFALDSDAGHNETNKTYVAWAWKAGGNSNTFNIDDVGYATASAAGLTAGTKTPTGASVNTKSGFSIIAFTGDQNAGTISHGLGKAPSFYIVKTRDSNSGGSNDWYCYHSALGASARIQLNSTSAQTTGSSQWNSTSPTSSVLSLGSGAWQETGDRFIIYAWAEIPGFSKFGSYTGNNSANGPVVITGFRPRWILWKNSSAGSAWTLMDTERSRYNAAVARLRANGSDAENTTGNGSTIDILSNGFKVRTTGTDINDSTNVYIYAAFAEAPTFNLYGAQANAR